MLTHCDTPPSPPSLFQNRTARSAYYSWRNPHYMYLQTFNIFFAREANLRTQHLTPILVSYSVYIPGICGGTNEFDSAPATSGAETKRLASDPDPTNQWGVAETFCFGSGSHKPKRWSRNVLLRIRIPPKLPINNAKQASLPNNNFLIPGFKNF